MTSDNSSNLALVNTRNCSITIFVLVTTPNPYIQTLLDSVCRQSLQSEQITFCISYNGSSREYLQYLQSFSLPVHSYSQPPNSLFTHMEACLSSTDSSFIQFIHSDDYIDHNYTRFLSESLLSDPLPATASYLLQSNYIDSSGHTCKRASNHLLSPQSKHRIIQPFSLLLSYFSLQPFKAVFPATIYSSETLRAYYRAATQSYGVHEDVLILYHLSLSTLYLLPKISGYSYRRHSGQVSASKDAAAHLQLINYIKKTDIPPILRYTILTLYIIQHILFFRNISNRRIYKPLKHLRKAYIRYRER